MSWVTELYDLYDRNAEQAGIITENNPVLLPVYHTTVTAQIEVTLDYQGNFLKAVRIPEEEKSTVIPVTDKSSSRTNTPAPNPLCDNLKYLAGDYMQYVPGKDYSKNHTMYLEELKKWVQSPYSHEKAEAIYRYLCQKTLMKDLIDAGVMETDDNGKVDLKKKIQNVFQADAFVRFRVEMNGLMEESALEDHSGKFFAECWKDRTLQEQYIRYCRSSQEMKGLSYLSGQYTGISYLHPKKIRNESDGAKLISSNDDKYFTFRGRFRDKEEAFAIGYEDSQKIHNALKWIIRKQGVYYDGMYLVTWESNLQPLPDWQADSDTISVFGREDGWEEGSVEDEWEKEEAEEEQENEGKDTGEADAARFYRAIQGYEKNLDLLSRTMIMALDAATTGRLALMEFKEYSSSRYLESLKNWYHSCEWIHPKKGKKGRYFFKGMVGIRDATELLYGTEQTEYFSLKGRENMYKEVAKRWMPCILENREVPQDMVNLAVRRASSPVSFESTFLWKRVLALACSLVRQQYLRRYKEEWSMALNENRQEREYLYGRLLALADRIEYRTYDKEEERETNARRYMNAFSQHPYRTWKIIEEKLSPYFSQLRITERLKYKGMMDSIFELFREGEFENDNPLTGLYLLGFHNQSYALKNSNETNKEEEA